MITTKKRETIYLEPKKRKALCEALNVSMKTYYNAVNYITNSESAEKIRKEALKFYGGIKIIKTIIVRP